eukprot:2933597-Pyramimonas_sp.AAC.1
MLMMVMLLMMMTMMMMMVMMICLPPSQCRTATAFDSPARCGMILGLPAYPQGAGRPPTEPLCFILKRVRGLRH